MPTVVIAVPRMIAAIVMTEVLAARLVSGASAASAAITVASAVRAATRAAIASAMSVATLVIEVSAASAATEVIAASAMNGAAPGIEVSKAIAATVIAVASVVSALRAAIAVSVVIAASPGMRRHQEVLHAHRVTEDTHPNVQHRRVPGRIANLKDNLSEARDMPRHALRSARGTLEMSSAPMLRVHAEMNAITRPVHRAVPNGVTGARTRALHAVAPDAPTIPRHAMQMTSASH